MDIILEKRKCIKCGEDKPISNFSEYKKSINNRCKICINDYVKKYYNERREKKRKKDLEYYFKNKELITEKRIIYNENNPKRQKEYNKLNLKRNNLIQKIRYKNDINYKLRKSITSRIGKELKAKGKIYRSHELLGCSVEDFKIYLENQFLPEFTWENHGIIWEIDHVKPCDLFNLENIEEQKICFHYKNTQPLFKTTEIAESFGYINYTGNRNKGNKILSNE